LDHQRKTTLVENNNHDIPQVTDEENKFLIAPFTKKEVKEAVFQIGT
jgi:hypothetical protein